MINFEKKQTKNGFGLFSKVYYPANSVLFEFECEIYTEKDISGKDPHDYIQIGLNKYMGLSGRVYDHLNHSCEPNCGLRIFGNRMLLVSIWDIQPDMELTFDYSTSSTDTFNQWSMDCLCGSFNCRKKISGFQYLSDELKDFYKSKNIIPNYLK